MRGKSGRGERAGGRGPRHAYGDGCAKSREDPRHRQPVAKAGAELAHPSDEIWQNRIALDENREVLRSEVDRIAAKLKRGTRCRGFPADMAERLAIEAALTKRGLLSRQGGRC